MPRHIFDLIGLTILAADTGTGLVVTWNGSKSFAVFAVADDGVIEEAESWIAYESPTLAEATAVAERYLEDARREMGS